MIKKENLNNDLPEKVNCPLYKKIISSDKCCDLALVIDKLAPRRMTDFNIEHTLNCRKICKNCKYHDR